MIEVLHTAPMLTVQASGRRGWRHLGVPTCGAMDTPALRLANLLLGNVSQAAALEVTAGPLTLRSHGAHALVWMGADMQASITLSRSTRSVLPGFVMDFPEGSELRVSRAGIPGQRGLIAFAGGIDVPRVLGSRSTDVNNGFGGYQGRALRAGDQLPIKHYSLKPNSLKPGSLRPDSLRPDSPMTQALTAIGVRQAAPTFVLRAIRSLDYEGFKGAAQSAFWHSPWRVSTTSNRMGLRLQGQPLSVPPDTHRFSSGVLPGMIQVPPDGQPILLGPDAQTMGGYPVIASVIEADLWQLAYLTPGTPVRFSEVSIAEAQGLLAAQTRERRLLAWRLQNLRELLLQADTA